MEIFPTSAQNSTGWAAMLIDLAALAESALVAASAVVWMES